MLHQIEGEGGLAHAGPAGHHHQIGFLPAGGEFVQVGVAAGKAHHPVGGFGQSVEMVDGFLQKAVDALRFAAVGAVIGDFQDFGLGLVQHLAGASAFGVETAVGDGVGGADEVAQHGPLTDDLGVGFDVGRAPGAAGQAAEVVGAAGGFQLVEAVQGFGEGHHIYGLTALALFGHGLKDATMFGAVEIIRQQDVGDALPLAVVLHQPPQHRLLGLDRMRRHLENGKIVLGGRGGFISVRHLLHLHGSWCFMGL